MDVSLVDGSVLVFIAAWAVVRGRIFRTPIKQQRDRHTRFLYSLSYILTTFLYAIAASFIIFVIMHVIKLVLLDQFAKVSGGVYFYSTDGVLRAFTRFLTSKPHMIFNLTMLAVLTAYTYACVMWLMPDSTEESVQRNASVFVFDTSMVIYVMCYLAWLSLA